MSSAGGSMWLDPKASVKNKSILASLTPPTTGNDGSQSRMLKLIILLGSIGGLLFGYDTGIISGALVLLASEFSLSEVEQELVVGVCIAGAFTSATGVGYLADRYGRRRVVLGSSVSFILGSVMLCLANSVWLLYAGRFVVGLGVGSASMIVPLLLSECSPAASRGAVVTCVNVAITFGQLFACATAAVLQPYPAGWRIMLGLAAVPAVVQFLGFWYYIPESPRWLCRRGFVDKGTLALRQLRDAYDVREELGEILDSVQAERDALEAEFGPSATGAAAGSLYQQRGESVQGLSTMNISASGGSASPVPASTAAGLAADNDEPPVPGPALPDPTLRQMLSKSAVRRPLLLGVLVQVLQQVAGINTVMYYSATIFTATGTVSQSKAIWLALGTAACNFVGSILGQRLTDPLGRRRLAMGSLLAVIAALLAIAAAFHFSDLVLDVSDQSSADSSAGSDTVSSSAASSSDPLKTDSQTFQTWSIFAAICVYLLVFAPGLGSVPWTICSEIFPASCRGVATSVTTSANWAANFLVSVSFLTCIRLLGAAGTFLLSACLSTVLGAWLYLYLPETKGVALEDVPILFSDELWGATTSWPALLRDCCGGCCSASGGGAAGAAGEGANRTRGSSRGFFYSTLGINVEDESSAGSRGSRGSDDADAGDAADAADAGRARRTSVKL